VFSNLVVQPETPALDDRIFKPYGVREAGWISLSGCQQNRVQLTHRFKIEGRPGISEERYRGQVLALSMLDTGVTKATKAKYWNWFDEALLEPIKASQPDAYRDIVEQVQALITEAAERDSDGGPDGD
jgi:hypothetical protein